MKLLDKDIASYKDSEDTGFDMINQYHKSVDEDMQNATLYNKARIGVGRNPLNIGQHIFEDIKPTASGGGYDSNYPGVNVDIANDMKIEVPDFNKFARPSTLADPDEMLKNRFSRFSRYGYIDLSGEFLTGTREYLFFSKPDLHLMNYDGSIYDQLLTNPFLCEAYKHYRYSFYSLQQYYGGSNEISGDSSVGPVSKDSATAFDINCKYIPLLTNMATSTLDLGDITAGEVENNRNLYGITTTYREGSLSSDLGFDFSIEFKDTKYLDVYMMFKIFDEYERHKYFSDIEPNRPEYVINRIYPEALSIWKLIVDDTDRVIYWAKATACVPMNVPRGAVSNIEGVPKFTINWKAQFISDMNPIQLAELNNLTMISMNVNGLDGADIALPSDGETWVGYPYIIPGGNTRGFNTPRRTGDYSASEEQTMYKLIWIH